MHVVAMSKSKMANTEMVKDNRLIDGRAVQARILSEVSTYVKQTSAMHPIGRLVSICIGNIPEVGDLVGDEGDSDLIRTFATTASQNGGNES